MEAIRKKPAYTYSRWWNRWRVYKMEYTAKTASGSKVYEFDTMEEARAKTYALNGWKL